MEHHSKAASVFGNIGKFLRKTSGIIRKVPCYQSSTVLRNFIVEVRILRNAFKIYLEKLPINIFFSNVSVAFAGS